jgi:hypothetical protein
MTELLNRAVESVRALPAADQDRIAIAMISLAGLDDDPEAIGAEHLAAVLEGLAQARRGERAAPERVEAAFRRFEA